MNFPDSKFWDFSVNTYRSGDVEKVCLQLQNEYNADINIILYCCWAGHNHVGLCDIDIEQLISTTSPWQSSILKPLRAARNTLKQHIIAMPADMIDQTLSNLSEMELNAERMSQLAMEKTIKLHDRDCCKDKTALQCTMHNLELYLQTLPIDSMDSVDVQIDTIISAVFHDKDTGKAVAMPAEATS
ncbi:MAG: TIGR02444 family protein [Gammaproteobacteria bacterium]|nr:TIGR02444 family protein [Gammaproteobacteria bacterium]